MRIKDEARENCPGPRPNQKRHSRKWCSFCGTELYPDGPTREDGQLATDSAGFQHPGASQEPREKL